MAKLYYGNGNCSIEGRDIVGVEINYRGSIFIDDKTPSNYAIMQKNNKIIIFPYGRGKDLSNLFDYNGEFRITSLIASDKNAQKVSTSIHKVLDYSEFLDSNSEDMTVKSEDLNQGFVSNNRVRSAGIKQTHIKSLHTDDWNMEVYKKSGILYEGEFSISLEDGTAITPNDEELYYKADGKLLPTKNTGNPPYGVLRRKAQLKRRKNNITRRGRRRNY